MRGVAKFGEGSLEILDYRTTDEAGGAQQLVEYSREFVFQLLVRSGQIKKRYLIHDYPFTSRGEPT